MTEIDNVSDIKNEIKQALAKCNKTPWILTLQNVDLHYKAHEWITFLLSENTSLITTIESQKEEIRRRVIQAEINISLGETVINMQAEIESLKAITELAVKGLEKVANANTGFPRLVAREVLSEIARLQNDPIS